MYYFKTKLIISIVVVFLTFHDADGKSCVEQLHDLKYKSDKNFLDHYLIIFNGFNLEDDFDSYDAQISSTVAKCLAEPSSVLNWEPITDFGYSLMSSVAHLFCNAMNKLANSAIRMLCKYDTPSEYSAPQNEDDSDDDDPNATVNELGLAYFCDLLIIIYGIYDIDNAYQYCENHENYDTTPSENDILECQEGLQNVGLMFSRGLDNYAYYKLKMTSEKEITVEGEAGQNNSSVIKYKNDYITFLQNEIDIRVGNTGNTNTWCSAMNCESELNKNGFTSRMVGPDNYRVIVNRYDGNCNNVNNSLANNYCNYLKNNNSFTTQVLFGSFEWCMYTVEDKEVPVIKVD